MRLPDRSATPRYHRCVLATDRPPTRRAAPRAVGLDVLRGAAALGVLVTHVGFATGVVNEARIGSSLRLVIPRLDVGVSIFFVLSGLLVARPFVAAYLDGTAMPSLVRYARRRLGRVYPLYWVVLAATLALAGSLPRLPELLADVALVHIYHPSTAIGPITQSWSLATELSFYAFVPLWFGGLQHLSTRRRWDRAGRARALWIGLFGWVAISLLWRLAVIARTETFDLANPTGVDVRGAYLTWLPNHLDTFAVGVALALSTHLGRLPRFTPIARTASYALAAAALWICSTALDLPPLFTGFDGPQTLARHALFVVVAAALVAPSAHAMGPARVPVDEAAGASTRSPLGLAGARFVSGLALASYGVYLWHQLVTEEWFAARGLADFQAAFPSTLAAVVAISLLLSAITYWLVERPAGDLTSGRLALPSGPSRPLGRIPRLEALRGLAVLAVLATHIVFLDDGSDRWALRGGFLGVDVFLVLSGFLIGGVLLDEVDRRGSIDGARFTRRRLRRLYPALAVFLVVQAVVAVQLGAAWPDQLRQVLYALGGVANLQLSWGEQPPFELVHLWSLSLELQFYVLMAVGIALLARRIDRARALAAAAMLVAAAVALWRLWMFERGIDPVALYQRPDIRADSMLFGVAAALARRSGMFERRTVVVAGLAGALVLVVSAVFARPDDWWLFAGGFTVVAAASAAVVLALAEGPDASRTGPPVRGLARVADVRLLRGAGTISYSLYLWHLPVYLWTVRALPDAPLWQLAVIAVPASLLAGWLSFVLVERRTLPGARSTA